MKESKLTQFTGNLLLKLHTSGKTPSQKFPSPCAYTNVMLESVGPRQKFQLSKNLLRRYLLMYSLYSYLQSYYAHILVFLWPIKHQVLPHVKRAGYNAIQLIGIPEHKDYFTVGYRVSNLNFSHFNFLFYYF